MLLYTKEEIVNVYDSIVEGKELTLDQLNVVYCFISDVRNKIERKTAAVLEIAYPSVWKEFFELDNFKIYGETLYLTYVNNDNELVSFSFPLKLLGLSKAELDFGGGGSTGGW